MKCEICGRSPATDSDVMLTRANEKGVTGIWRCQYHPKKGYEATAEDEMIYDALHPRKKQ